MKDKSFNHDFEAFVVMDNDLLRKPATKFTRERELSLRRKLWIEKMSVFRVDKSRDFTVISNTVFKDKTISARAKGLLVEMLSLPENWDYTLKGLASLFSDGIDSIRSGIVELEAHGYVVRQRVRDEKGRMKGMEYVIYENPQPVEKCGETEVTESKNTDETLQNCPSPTEIEPVTEMPTVESAMTYKELNKSNTYESITESNQSIADEIEKQTASPMDRIGYEEARELIRENIDYEVTCEAHSKEQVDELVELCAETLCSLRTQFRFGEDIYPYSLVKSRLLKLDSACIDYVFFSLDNTKPDIRNIKKYLLKTLINAPSTIGNYYGARVNFDLYGGEPKCRRR